MGGLLRGESTPGAAGGRTSLQGAVPPCLCRLSHAGGCWEPASVRSPDALLGPYQCDQTKAEPSRCRGSRAGTVRCEAGHKCTHSTAQT